MRTLLFEWMAKVCQARLLSRETYALATFYADKYISQKKNVSKNEFQLVGFSAVFLAAKIDESKILSRDLQLFKLQDVTRMQKDICQILKYRLNPDTYIYWLNSLTFAWDTFVASTFITDVKYMGPTRDEYMRLRTLYDLADCINLDVRSFDFCRMNLMAGLLYVVTRKFHFNQQFAFSKFQNFEQVYLTQDTFKSQFVDFLNSLSLSNLQINDGIIRYMYPFLTLQIDFSNKSDSKSYIEYISTQNNNRKAFGLVKGIIESRRK